MQNLEHVKPGDELAIPAHGRGYHPVKVDRVTATQIICEAGPYGKRSIRRRDGLVMDGGSVRRWARPMTDELRADMELERRINYARAALREFKVTSENVDLVEELLRADQRMVDCALSHVSRRRPHESGIRGTSQGCRVMKAARFIASVRAVLYCLRRPHYRPVRTRDALGRVVAIGATRSSVPTVVFWRAS